MIPRRDKDFLSSDFECPILLWFGFGPHQTQIRPAMGLGQVHGACPITADHIRQIGLFLRLCPMGVDGRICTMREALIHPKGHVGAGKHFANYCSNQIGQALTTEYRITVDACPAAFFHLFKGVFETSRGADHTIFEMTSFLIAHGIQWGQNL